MARLSIAGRKKASKSLLRAFQAGFRKAAVGVTTAKATAALTREELHRRIFERMRQHNLLSDEEPYHVP